MTWTSFDRLRKHESRREVIESPDIIGVWEHDQVLFVAGHNLFEQAPALGQAVARAACGKGLADHLRPEAKLGETPGPG